MSTKLTDLLEGAIFLTALRDPIEHIASHIRWLDHYNAPEFQQEYKRLGEGTRLLVDLIGETDLSNVGSLDKLLTALPPTGVQLLDNCQARYFLCGGSTSVEPSQPLDLSMVTDLRNAAAKFDLIIRQDALDNGLAAASKLAGLSLDHRDARVNPAPSTRKIDTSNPVVRSVLGKRTLVDQWLWRATSGKDACQIRPSAAAPKKQRPPARVCL